MSSSTRRSSLSPSSAIARRRQSLAVHVHTGATDPLSPLAGGRASRTTSRRSKEREPGNRRFFAGSVSGIALAGGGERGEGSNVLVLGPSRPSPPPVKAGRELEDDSRGQITAVDLLQMAISGPLQRDTNGEGSRERAAWKCPACSSTGTEDKNALLCVCAYGAAFGPESALEIAALEANALAAEASRLNSKPLGGCGGARTDTHAAMQEVEKLLSDSIKTPRASLEQRIDKENSFMFGRLQEGPSAALVSPSTADRALEVMSVHGRAQRTASSSQVGAPAVGGVRIPLIEESDDDEVGFYGGPAPAGAESGTRKKPNEAEKEEVRPLSGFKAFPTAMNSTSSGVSAASVGAQTAPTSRGGFSVLSSSPSTRSPVAQSQANGLVTAESDDIDANGGNIHGSHAQGDDQKKIKHNVSEETYSFSGNKDRRLSYSATTDAAFAAYTNKANNADYDDHKKFEGLNFPQVATVDARAKTTSSVYPQSRFGPSNEVGDVHAAALTRMIDVIEAVAPNLLAPSQSQEEAFLTSDCNGTSAAYPSLLLPPAPGHAPHNHTVHVQHVKVVSRSSLRKERELAMTAMISFERAEMRRKPCAELRDTILDLVLGRKNLNGLNSSKDDADGDNLNHPVEVGRDDAQNKPNQEAREKRENINQETRNGHDDNDHRDEDPSDDCADKDLFHRGDAMKRGSRNVNNDVDDYFIENEIEGGDDRSTLSMSGDKSTTSVLHPHDDANGENTKKLFGARRGADPPSRGPRNRFRKGGRAVNETISAWLARRFMAPSFVLDVTKLQMSSGFYRRAPFIPIFAATAAAKGQAVKSSEQSTETASPSSRVRVGREVGGTLQRITSVVQRSSKGDTSSSSQKPSLAAGDDMSHISPHQRKGGTNNTSKNALSLRPLGHIGERKAMLKWRASEEREKTIEQMLWDRGEKPSVNNDNKEGGAERIPTQATARSEGCDADVDQKSAVKPPSKLRLPPLPLSPTRLSSLSKLPLSTDVHSESYSNDGSPHSGSSSRAEQLAQLRSRVRSDHHVALAAGRNPYVRERSAPFMRLAVGCPEDREKMTRTLHGSRPSSSGEGR